MRKKPAIWQRSILCMLWRTCISKKNSQKGDEVMSKIQMTTPIVEMDGDEMTQNSLEDDKR